MSSSKAIASAATNGEEPPSKKKKPATEPTLNPSLPDDLVVTCLARISRLQYQTLSLVSKSFRSLLASPELYQTRSRLNRTESCLYVCLRFPSDSNPNQRWFTLSRKPDKLLSNHISNKKKKKNAPSGNLLVPVSFLNSPPVELSNLVAVSHNLYAPIENAPSSNFSFLDCRTHTWLEAPSIQVVRTGSSEIDIDGCMYLPGYYENLDSLNCFEVFNTNTKTWKPVPQEKCIATYWSTLPQEERRVTIRNLEGKLYMSSIGMALNPKEMTLEAVGLDTESDRRSVCVIKNITYIYSKGLFQWTSLEGGASGILEGLEGLPMFASYSTVKLVDYGGKLLVLWDKNVPASGYKEKMIWCAVISLERRSNEEIWGKVEWFDAVLTVPKSYRFVYAVAATL